MKPPEIEERGGEIVYVWRDEGIGLALDRFRETDAGLVKAFVTVESTRAEQPGHVFWGLVTLTTAGDRRTVTAKIQRIAPLADGVWEGQVDRTFQNAAQRYLRVPEPLPAAAIELDESAGYLFRPVVPLAQVGLLMADQGASKSYLLQYLGFAVAGGYDTVFGPPAVTGPVIYFDWETDSRSWRRRLERIRRGMGVAEVPADYYYLCMQDRGRLADRVRDMRQQIARLGAVLAIVDSLTFATGGDLNSTEMVNPTMAGIGSLGDTVTKLAAAHYAKAHRKETGPASVIGSALFEFKARGLWELRRESEAGTAFNVAMIHRKLSDDETLAPLAYRIAFDNDAGSVVFSRAEVADSHELAERSLSVATRIRALLRSRPAAKGKTDEIAELLNVRADDVRRTLNRMPDVVRLAFGSGRGNASEWGLSGDQPEAGTVSRNGRFDEGGHSDENKAGKRDALKLKVSDTVSRAYGANRDSSHGISRDCPGFSDQIETEEGIEELPF